MKMRGIIILLVLLAACKKEKTEPKEPEPQPTSCSTAPTLNGTWKDISSEATFTISFIKDNCPTKSNKYMAKGLNAIIQARLKPGETYVMQDSTFNFEETTSTAFGFEYRLAKGADATVLTLQHNEITSDVTFKKLP